MLDIISYGCGRILPGAVEYDVCSLPEEKPRLIFIDANQSGALDLLNNAIRKRIALVICGVTSANLGKILAFSSASHRNQAPVAILGSWRYIPAVAAIKEIVNTACLGKELTIKSSEINDVFNAFCLKDIAKWIDAQFANSVLQNTLDVSLEISGDNGWIKTDFSLDGKQAEFYSCLGGHTRHRIIPAANPEISELAILDMSLPPEGRIKTLPMMMTI